MIIKTKFNIGEEVCFLSRYGEIEGGIITSISVDVSKRDEDIYYVIAAYNKNICSTSKIENEIYHSIEELKENIEQITLTTYRYK